MEEQKIGLLHPGAMGSFIAASVRTRGYPVYWVSEGRSAQSRQRAERAGLVDAGSVARLCQTCEIILSVCPPHAAEAVADEVLGHAFRGLFLDANAISPLRATAIAARMEQAGAAFVDGGIIGGPAWESGQTHLYLAGTQAGEIAALFTGSSVVTGVLGESAGQASALKMTYAAYTKGTTALLCAILAAAEALGVRAPLEAQWSSEDEGFAERTGRRVTNVTAKAWRFTGEMEEIAATFEQAGLPGEFHLGAAEVYRRLAGFKDAPSTPPLAEVLQALSRRG